MNSNDKQRSIDFLYRNNKSLFDGYETWPPFSFFYLHVSQRFVHTLTGFHWLTEDRGLDKYVVCVGVQIYGGLKLSLITNWVPNRQQEFDFQVRNSKNIIVYFIFVKIFFLWLAIHDINVYICFKPLYFTTSLPVWEASLLHR